MRVMIRDKKPAWLVGKEGLPDLKDRINSGHFYRLLRELPGGPPPRLLGISMWDIRNGGACPDGTHGHWVNISLYMQREYPESEIDYSTRFTFQELWLSLGSAEFHRAMEYVVKNGREGSSPVYGGILQGYYKQEKRLMQKYVYAFMAWCLREMRGKYEGLNYGSDVKHREIMETYDQMIEFCQACAAGKPDIRLESDNEFLSAMLKKAEFDPIAFLQKSFEDMAAKVKSTNWANTGDENAMNYLYRVIETANSGYQNIGKIREMVSHVLGRDRWNQILWEWSDEAYEPKDTRVLKEKNAA